MARDGNVRYRLFETLIDLASAKKVDGLSPNTIARYLRSNTPRLSQMMEPLVPFYEIQPPIDLTSSAKRRDANIEAMRLLERLDGGETLSTRLQHKVLGQFSGWGGLSLERVAHELPYAQDSIGLAHEWYTPTGLTDAVADALQPFLPELADRRGRIKALEPAAGVGRLVGSLNRRTKGQSFLWHTVELNKVAARILGILHPHSDVFTGPFERYNAEHGEHRGTWKLVIANPPFGSSAAIREYATEDPDRDYREKFDYAYFLRRSLDALAVGGIGVFIVPNSFMTGASTSDLRGRLLLSHHLMASFRIPSHTEGGKSTFPSQSTVTDVIFFRSRGGQMAALDDNDRYIVAGEYYKKHPAHLLGREVEAGAKTASGTQFRYSVVGEFEGLPSFDERPACNVCTIQPRPVRARPRRSSRLTRRRAEIDDPALSRASAVGIRVVEFLSNVARNQITDADGQWREVHDAVVALAAAHGNPWQWEELRSLADKDDEGAQGLLRAFDPDGALVTALRTAPKAEVSYKGSDDPRAQAEWIYGAQRSLTVDELIAFHTRHGGTRRDEVLHELLGTQQWFLDGANWDSLVPADVYLSGDLWPKYDRAVAQGDDDVARRQAEILLGAIGPKTYEDLQDVSPQQTWVPLPLVAAWLGETLNEGYGQPRLSREDGLLSAGSSTLTMEASWFVGWSNHSRSVFSPRQPIDISEFEDFEIPEAIQAEIKKSAELGENEDIDVRRLLYALKWNTRFREWCAAGIDRQDQLSEAYNRTFLGHVAPTFDSTPVAISRWTDDPKLQLAAHQTRTLKARAATRGGLLGFDVGVGKTFTALAIVALGRQQGWIRRPAVVVPSGIVWQRRDEVKRVLPDYQVLVVGKRKGTTVDTPEERAAKWTEFQAGLWDLVLITDTVLGKTKVDTEDLVAYASQRTAIMRSLRLSQASAQSKKPQKRSERQRSILKSGVKAWVEETLKQETSVYDPGLAWSDLGIDFLVYDEMGNIRNTWGPSPREFGVPKYMGSAQSGSWRGWQADFRASIVRRHTGGRGILGLTGTLGENSPVEIYNALQFIDPTILEKAGIGDPEQFIDRYLDIASDRVRRITGESVIQLAVVGFKNLRELRRILFRWGSFVSAKQAGLKLPISRVCQASVTLSESQEAGYQVLRKQARAALKRRASGAAFAVISKMRLTTIHPELTKGYTWETANGGIASKEASLKALPYWRERGWSPREERLTAEMDQETRPEVRQRLQGKIDALRLKRTTKDKYVMEKLLPQPDNMNSPKFAACAARVVANPGCGHIIFSQMTATHFWLREVLVASGVPRERIAIINSSTGEIKKIADGFNGTEEIAPIFDVVIANSRAYRGANLQRRTCSIHNVDLTWTPADMEQRRGRADRQGNTQPVLQIWYYFAKHSFDGFQFSLLAGKAKWQDALYRSDDDRSVNPAAQLNLSEAQLLRLTASSEAEGEELDRQLKAEADGRDLARGHANALKLMRAAAERYRLIREGRADPARRQSLRDEADERLRTLAAMPDEVWPWRAIQDVARTQDVLVPASVDFTPLYEGLQTAGVHVGRVVWEKRSVGLRPAGSVFWTISEEPELSGAAWTAEEREGDAEGAALEIENLLAQDELRWETLGWTHADQQWLRTAWAEYGAQLIPVIARQSKRLPILDDGGVRIAGGDDLVSNAARVIPPTLDGWAFFEDAVRRSTIKTVDVREVARFWFQRRYNKRAPGAARGALSTSGSSARVRPVACPEAVYSLRPPELVDQVTPVWESLDLDAGTWRPAPFAVELMTTDGRTSSVEVSFDEPPNEAQFIRGILQVLFNAHISLVHDLEDASRVLSDNVSSESWIIYGAAQGKVAASIRELETVVGETSAHTMDMCARRLASRSPAVSLDEGIASILKRYDDAGDAWQDRPAAVAAARREIKKWLARQGADEPGAMANAAVDRALERARSGAAPEESEAEPLEQSAEVEVDSLPELVRATVRGFGQSKGVVTMHSALEDTLFVVGGRGKIGRAAVLNLRAGEKKSYAGSYGGPNPFSESPVDTQKSAVEITTDTVLVKAVTGGGKAPYVWIIVHPTKFAELRPDVSLDDLSTGEKLALSLILSYTSAGRKGEFARDGLGHYGPENPFIKGLVRAGLLRIVAQSVRVTNQGKLHRSALRQNRLSQQLAEERKAEALATATETAKAEAKAKPRAKPGAKAQEKPRAKAAPVSVSATAQGASMSMDSEAAYLVVPVTVGGQRMSVPLRITSGGRDVV